MTRRLNALLVALALSRSLGPLPTAAPPPGKVWQVGYLSPTPPPPYRGAKRPAPRCRTPRDCRP